MPVAPIVEANSVHASAESFGKYARRFVSRRTSARRCCGPARPTPDDREFVVSAVGGAEAPRRRTSPPSQATRRSAEQGRPSHPSAPERFVTPSTDAPRGRPRERSRRSASRDAGVDAVNFRVRRISRGHSAVDRAGVRMRYGNRDDHHYCCGEPVCYAGRSPVPLTR